MNLVVLFLAILFTLFGTLTCAVLSQSSNSVKLNDSNIGQEEPASSSSLLDEKKLDDHAGDHDKGQKIVPRKGVNNIEADSDDVKVSAAEHPNHSISSDRASTTIIKDSESQKNGTSDLSSSTSTKDKVTNSSQATSSDKYSPYESKSTQNETSHTSSSNISKSEYTSTSNTSKSSLTKSTESASTNTSKSSLTKSTESASSKSSSFNKKPLVTYSVEDDPSLLNVPRVRQLTLQLTPFDSKVEADYAGNLSPSDDFIPDRMQTSKGALYIFPLVVLIFLVPMVLGIGIIVLRRVRDYWSTRHYRRMDFLVDGMYNT